MVTVGQVQGYKKKPLAIVVIAAIFVLMPLGMLGQLFVVSGGSWSVLWEIVGSRYFVQEWLLSWSAAAAVFVVSRWSFVYFVALSSSVLTTRFVHLLRHPNLETPASLFITIAWFGVAIYFLASSLKAPYLNPRLRWWTRPPRLKLCRDATITVEGKAIPVVVLNISEGGAFVKVDESIAASQPLPQRLGQQFEFSVALTRSDQPESTALRVASRGELVWSGKPDSPYRNGFGIKFIRVSRDLKRHLRRYIRDETRRDPSAA